MIGDHIVISVCKFYDNKCFKCLFVMLDIFFTILFFNLNRKTLIMVEKVAASNRYINRILTDLFGKYWAEAAHFFYFSN